MSYASLTDNDKLFEFVVVLKVKAPDMTTAAKVIHDDIGGLAPNGYVINHWIHSAKEHTGGNNPRSS